MKTSLPPIYHDVHQLWVRAEAMVRRFPRYHKYAVGTNLCKAAMASMRSVHRAVFECAQQARLVHWLNRSQRLINRTQHCSYYHYE